MKLFVSPHFTPEAHLIKKLMFPFKFAREKGGDKLFKTLSHSKITT